MLDLGILDSAGLFDGNSKSLQTSSLREGYHLDSNLSGASSAYLLSLLQFVRLPSFGKPLMRHQ